LNNIENITKALEKEPFKYLNVDFATTKFKNLSKNEIEAFVSKLGETRRVINSSRPDLMDLS
jgi:hypothetical protein